MPTEDKFLVFIKKEQINCEKYLKDIDAYDKYPEKIEDQILICYENLAVIYRYGDDIEKSEKMLRHLTTFGYNAYTSRFAGLSEESKNKINLLVSTGKWQLRNGISFNLAKMESQKANSFLSGLLRIACFQMNTLQMKHRQKIMMILQSGISGAVTPY